MAEEKKKVGDNTLSLQEAEIIDHLREVDYGEVRIVITAGKPLRVEEIKKTYML